MLSGLRTAYNDTEVYIYNFVYRIPENFTTLISYLDQALGQNPGFFLYQYIIKVFILNDPQVFLFLSALLTNIFFVMFYKKYSPYFTFSLFLYFASGLFILGMAAIKQMLAMALGLWAISFFLNNRHIAFVFIILVASTIHPFILMYLSAFVLDSKVWTKLITLGFFMALSAGFVFSQFVDTLLVAAENIGMSYSADYVLGGAGLNPLRLLVFSIVPALSIIYKKQINKSNDRILILSTNFSIISFIFMILASFGGAFMIGRLGNYFEPFIYISLPWIVYRYVRKKYRLLYIPLLVSGYIFFYYYQFTIAKHFVYKSIWF